MIKLRQDPTLNLTLEGTTGSFQVGTGRIGQSSLEVKYLLTHVGLDFATGTDDALMSSLAPVREMFDSRTLDFDEIMQRDIDDARVSAELVPYLLDKQAREMIKLFPPIVVVVLPVREGANAPGDRYPAVVKEMLPPDALHDYPLSITRSGAIGREVFQFEQPAPENHPLYHDLVRLKLNTHRTRLVIVDGQHRAMALLAIYRNLKDQWSDERRAPYKEYYAEWTPNYIGQFNLEQIQLPVMLCTVPDLDENYEGDFDLKRASRSIFLTLNKTARKVSDSRNKLLDDNDLIANFMRRCLSDIKRKDERSPYAMRVWNVELDQYLDKVKLQSSIALTGVSHVYYIVEHLMMEKDLVSGISPRSGKFYKRVHLNDCLDRLDGWNLLGAAVADALRRDQFTADAAHKLGDSFMERYGRFLIACLERFAPYNYHCLATLATKVEVESSTYREILPIIFDGQGINRVFDAHRENLKQKLANGTFSSEAPEIQASANRLEGTSRRIDEALASMRRNRANLYLDPVGDRKALHKQDDAPHDNLLQWINGLYENVFTTVAFQSALICGFFSELDRARIDVDVRDAIFDEYIEQVSEFFSPRSVPKLRKLFQLMYGEISGTSVENWRVVPSNQAFRSIVYRGEMQPDQWPKYKYLILEVWKPSNSALAASIENERQKCRAEVFRDLHHAYKAAHCQELRKAEEDLSKEEQRDIFERAYSAYNGFMKNLEAASSLTQAAMRAALQKVPAAPIVQTDADGGFWQDAEE